MTHFQQKISNPNQPSNSNISQSSKTPSNTTSIFVVFNKHEKVKRPKKLTPNFVYAFLGTENRTMLL